jgi:triosephosphate isomerase
MLRDLFCRYVIVGHSERRQIFGETDEIINKKSVAALASRLRPIICVGETLKEREADKTLSVIEKQCKDGFKGFTAEQWSNVVVAYEPVWAIGTGKTATSAQAQEVHAAIRKLITTAAGEAVAEKVRILYGGSVKPDNARELMSQEDIDGALVGGASLEAEPFAKIIRAAAVDDEDEEKKA